LISFSGSKGKHFVNYVPNSIDINSGAYICLTMLLFLFYFFLAYMAYRLVFDFLLPIYRTTKQVRRGFQNMQDQMNGQNNHQANGQTAKQPGKPVGDYIDFEEVKDK